MEWGGRTALAWTKGSLPLPSPPTRPASIGCMPPVPRHAPSGPLTVRDHLGACGGGGRGAAGPRLLVTEAARARPPASSSSRHPRPAVSCCVGVDSFFQILPRTESLGGLYSSCCFGSPGTVWICQYHTHQRAIFSFPHSTTQHATASTMVRKSSRKNKEKKTKPASAGAPSLNDRGRYQPQHKKATGPRSAAKTSKKSIDSIRCALVIVVWID